MFDDATGDDLFATGNCGATLARNLLRSLAPQEPQIGFSILSTVLDCQLISTGLRSIAVETLLADFRDWLGVSDPQIEYQYSQLIAYALDRVGITPGAGFDLLAMQSAYSAGDCDAAEKIAVRLLAGGEADGWQAGEIHNILGRIYSDWGDYLAAAKEFATGAEIAHDEGLDDKEWDQHTNHVFCLQALGNHLMALRVIEGAERVARRMDDQHALAKTLLDMGNSHLALGDLLKAEEAYEGALDAARTAGYAQRESDALGNLGNLAMSKGKLDAAETYHRLALALSRNFPDKQSAQYDLNNLAQVLWFQGRSEEAIQAQEEALDIARMSNSDNTDGYLIRLNQMRRAMGQDPQAQSGARGPVSPSQSADFGPVQDDYELEGQVRALLNEQKVDSARQLLEERLRNSGSDVKAKSLYAVILMLAGEVAAAREQLEQAIKLQPDAMELHLRLVDIFGQSGNLDSLQVRYEQMVANDPFNAPARVALAMIYSRVGKLDDGIQQAMESARLKPDEELALRVLAETQSVKATSLLTSNWDAAWLVFHDCASTLQRLTKHVSKQKGQWLTYSAKLFESFAMQSHSLTPPLMGGMDSRELEILARAAGYYDQAQRSDPLRKNGQEIDRVEAYVQAVATPGQMTETAGHLVSSGNVHEALWLLTISLSRDPGQAEAYFQMALLVNKMAGREGRETVLGYLRRALSIDPNNVGYRNAEKFFLQPSYPDDVEGAGDGHDDA